jgi:hypothetical protein
MSSAPSPGRLASDTRGAVFTVELTTGHDKTVAFVKRFLRQLESRR